MSWYNSNNVLIPGRKPGAKDREKRSRKNATKLAKERMSKAMKEAWKKGLTDGRKRKQRKEVPCACGCGQTRINYDDRGRRLLYIAGHGGACAPGINSPHWKGGHTEANKRVRTKVWRMIRSFILERDRVCVLCSTVHNLTVHHIEPYRISEDNSIGNLVTLCRICHAKQERLYNTPKYFWYNQMEFSC